jgi:ATP-dependent RNA helicase SUPV3L1/SUV3
MLKAQDSQFRLLEDGRVCFQDNPTNPLPGTPFAMLVKGDSPLRPRLTFLEDDILKPYDRSALRETVEGWLARHLAAVLEPLVALANTEGLKAPARGIVFQIHEAMGIVPREQIEDLITTLDQEDRRELRARKIRLGPILVFIPALNKPAAVRLRALLWGLYNSKPLPMECPKDGIVSFLIDPAAVDKAFYQAIGYPVYGARAIRIDMLDRVINAIYDSAKDGKFKAQHSMAEWLGCSIEGLYEALGAMGHKKIEEAAPAEAASSSSDEAAAPASVESESAEAAAVVAEAPPATEAVQAEAKPAAVQVKPELAMFRLKRGKASTLPQARKKDTPGFAKKHGHKAENDSRPKASAGAQRSAREDRRPNKKGRGDAYAGDRIIAAAAAPTAGDSPFAILEQLKKKSDG